MIIFAADDPLVLNGTYDQEGYKPGERARITKARAGQTDIYRDSVGVERCCACLSPVPCDCPPSPKGSEPMATTRKNASRGARGRKTAGRKPVAKPRAPRPRQADLPGTEDRAIKPLEKAAADYADIRDQRIALNIEEVGLKAKLLRLMKEHGKQAYHRDGISIEIVHEEESVRVRVKKSADDNANDEAEHGDDVEAEAAGDDSSDAAEAVE